jgi:hypothetical protein
MFRKKNEVYRDKNATIIEGLGCCSLTDTLECGQAFRYEQLVKEDGYVEYLTVAYGKIIRVGQRKPGELIFYDEWTEEYEKTVREYFCFDTDFEEIRRDIISRTDSEWLKNAADYAGGIAILGQDPWEMLVSFIISQNNNIPRIKKIIKQICIEYGVNLTLQGNSPKRCHIKPLSTTPCQEKCEKCGAYGRFNRSGSLCRKRKRTPLSCLGDKNYAASSFYGGS